MARFDPKPGETIELFGEPFRAEPHPNALGVYAQDGRRGTIYKITNRGGESYALKVFFASYREDQVRIAERLAPFGSLQGMRAASRRVVVRGPTDPLPRNLDMAVLMPWIKGRTWFDVLQGTMKSRQAIGADKATRLCADFLRVVSQLEQHGIAHTDIAAGNVVVDLDRGLVELIDLEDIYGPGFPDRGLIKERTVGYGHARLGQIGLWRAEGDRFATAVLATEILALSDPGLLSLIHGESFFAPASVGLAQDPSFLAVSSFLDSRFPAFGRLFARAWNAQSLLKCPTVSELSACADATLAVRVPAPTQASSNLAPAPVTGTVAGPPRRGLGRPAVGGGLALSLAAGIALLIANARSHPADTANSSSSSLVQPPTRQTSPPIVQADPGPPRDPVPTMPIHIRDEPQPASTDPDPPPAPSRVLAARERSGSSLLQPGDLPPDPAPEPAPVPSPEPVPRKLPPVEPSTPPPRPTPDPFVPADLTEQIRSQLARERELQRQFDADRLVLANRIKNRCFDDQNHVPGHLELAVTIDRRGSVVHTRVHGDFRFTPTGGCAQDVAQGFQFPPSTEDERTTLIDRTFQYLPVDNRAIPAGQL